MSSRHDKERRSRTCSCINQNRATRQHQVKQLRNHRKRTQMRGERRRSRQTESEYCHCCHKFSKDSRKCRPSNGNSKRDQMLSKFVPQEHSIITDSRLIGHHGLFNHEIKSFNIERLLSERVKLEKAGKKGQETSHALLNRSASLRISSPFSSNNLFIHKAVLSPGRKADSDGQDSKRETSHKSDLMTSPRLYLSTESFRSCFSSKHSFDKEALTTVKGNSVTHEKENWPLQCGVTHRTPNSSERVPARKNLSLHRPSLDPGLRGERLASVSTMAARLCDSVHYTNLNRTDLLAESQLVLQRVLRAKHGTQLHENLLRNQRCSGFGGDNREMEQDSSQKPAIGDEDVFSAEASTCLFDEPVRRQENEEIINTNFDPWSLQPYAQEKAPEWPTNSVDTSPIFSLDILRPTRSTPLFVLPEPSGKSQTDLLFAPLPASSWPEKASQSHLWERCFNRPETKVSSFCASFENGSVSRSTEAGHESRSLKDMSIQQFSFSPSPLAETQFTPEMFKSDKYAFASPLYNRVHSPYMSSHFQIGPPLSSFHSETINYPSSYVLPSTSPPLFPSHSADNWSFPPMKMY